MTFSYVILYVELIHSSSSNSDYLLRKQNQVSLFKSFQVNLLQLSNYSRVINKIHGRKLSMKSLRIHEVDFVIAQVINVLSPSE